MKVNASIWKKPQKNNNPKTVSMSNNVWIFIRFLRGFHSYETENKTRPCDTPDQSSAHTKISLHVQIVQMETCICSINYQECSLHTPLQNPSVEKHGA